VLAEPGFCVGSKLVATAAPGLQALLTSEMGDAVVEAIEARVTVLAR